MIEIAVIIEQIAPYLSAALSHYGSEAITRPEDTTADSAANVGRRILQVITRYPGINKVAFQVALQDAAEDFEDPDAVAALRHQIRRTLRENPEIASAIAQMLPIGTGSVVITASGNRSVAAQTIGNIVIGDRRNPGNR